MLTIAVLSSGHTGRLPLIESPQSKRMKFHSQLKYCSGMLPLRPLASLYCWTFSSVARGLRRR